MWIIFKVFAGFVTLLFLFYILVSWSWGMWDLVSSTRDWTRIPARECEVLTTGPLGKSEHWLFMANFLSEPLWHYLAPYADLEENIFYSFKIWVLYTSNLCPGSSHSTVSISPLLTPETTYSLSDLSLSCVFAYYLPPTRSSLKARFIFALFRHESPELQQDCNRYIVGDQETFCWISDSFRKPPYQLDNLDV